MKPIKVLTSSILLTSLIALSAPAVFAGERQHERSGYRSHDGNAMRYNRGRHEYRKHRQVRRLKHQNRRLHRQLRRQRHYARDHYRAERYLHGQYNYRGHSYWSYPFSTSYYSTSPGYSVSIRYNDWAW